MPTRTNNLGQRRAVNSRRTDLFAGFWFLTICVALQLLSNQHTPRAVRGFLRRKISQVVSGAFIGIFVHSRLMLVTVHAAGDENDPFVPSLGVVTAIGLSLVGLMLLVVFIDRLAKTIQVATMTAEMARDTVWAIDLVHPDAYVTALDEVTAEDRSSPAGLQGEATLTYPGRAGYVTWTSLNLALPTSRSRSRPELLARPGDFVTARTPDAAWSSEAPLDASLRKVILRSVFVGDERDIDQGPAFGIRQLVDITLRAISAGTNDPTTALTCIGHLRDVFECLTERDLPATLSAVDSGVTHVAQQGSFSAYLEPLTEIASHATTDARVTISLLEVLAGAAGTSIRVGAVPQHRVFVDLARDLAQPALAHAETNHDRSRLEAVLTCVENAGPLGR